MSDAGDDTRASEAWLPEDVRVERWRLSEFIRLDFELDAAQALASSKADLRGVELLLARGCSHELARQISV